MGYYINPTDGTTKESWLASHGVRHPEIVPESARTTFEDKPCTCVVLVDNGAFTAAAIAYNDDELEAFTHYRDYRPKRFFLVPDEDLKQFCPIL